MVPEIAIWRTATLMLKRYGKFAELESTRRAFKLAVGGDRNAAAVWRRVAEAIGQLGMTTPPGPLH